MRKLCLLWVFWVTRGYPLRIYLGVGGVFRHPKPSLGKPWAGRKSENPIQPAIWRGLDTDANSTRLAA